jgi:hypothetical protein
MRGLRSFLVLLVILVALGAYLYFVESKRTPGDDAETKPKVFAVDAGAIEEITLKAEAGDATTLRKSGEDWSIVAPATAPADEAEVSGLTMNLASLEEQRLIDENPSDLAQFGLDTPRIDVGFKAAGQDHRLLIGGKTPTGADLYARTSASPKVFLIASYLESTFNRSTFDLRDKTALKFDRDSADSLEIVAGDRTVRFAKSGDDWQLAQPASNRSDAGAIEGLLARLDGLQMKAIAAAQPETLTTYGLDAPAATVRVGSGSSQAVLQVGAAAGEGERYARDAARPEVFTIEASLLDDLQKDAGEYRQKDLFDARAFNTTRIEVTRGAETHAFEKSTGKNAAGVDETKWRRIAPAAGDVDGAKVEGLLSALTSARATAFAPSLPPAATQEAAVSLQFDDGTKTERVTFHKSGDDAFAVREGVEPARIETSVLADILKALDELK